MFCAVRDEAQALRGLYTPLTTLMRLLMLPAAGYCADVCGRAANPRGFNL
jgi:hypothetical protein